MSRMTLLLCLLALLQASCATTGPSSPVAPIEPQVEVHTRIVDTGCDWNDPIYVNAADILSDDTAKQILAHNKAGAAKCGWKPNAKK